MMLDVVRAPGALVSTISNSTDTFFRTSRPPPPPPPGGTGLLGIDKTVEHRAWGLAGNVDIGACVVVHYELLLVGYDWDNESTYNMSALIFIF